MAQGTPLDVATFGPDALEMVFIRAPKIVRLGAQVTPLAACRGDIVLARQGHVLVSTFHPELTATAASINTSCTCSPRIGL